MTGEAARSRLPRLGHVVVAGAGRVGSEAVSEVLRVGCTRIVVIDRSAEALEQLDDIGHERVGTLLGDATDDSVLEAADIDEAAGVIAALPQPRDNLFLCLAVRQLNATARIVSRVEESSNPTLFRQVGADALVSPARLGGASVAHAMLQPGLAAFADAMMTSDQRRAVLREFSIPRHSPLSGLRLVEAAIQRRTGCVVLGLRRRARGAYVYQPGPKARLRRGGAMLALGQPDELERLTNLIWGQSE